MKKYLMPVFGVFLLISALSRPVVSQISNGGVGATPKDSTFNWQTPSTSDSGLWESHYSQQVVIQKIWCSTDGLGTVTMNFEIRPETAPNSTGTSVLTTPIVCTGSGASTTTILNPNIPGSASLGYIVTPIVTATSGSPGIVRASVIIL